jgi:DNA-binding HxlR family transcriptional regulator
VDQGGKARVRRREFDGCPIAGALQIVGDKWTMLIVRDLFNGPKRTTELLAELRPISSRTLLERLRGMEQERLVTRRNYRGNPPRVEYRLTERGQLLFPFLEVLMKLGESLGCGECEDRRGRLGSYCDFCPRAEPAQLSPIQKPAAPRSRRPQEDSIVLL